MTNPEAVAWLEEEFLKGEAGVSGAWSLSNMDVVTRNSGERGPVVCLPPDWQEAVALWEEPAPCVYEDLVEAYRRLSEATPEADEEEYRE